MVSGMAYGARLIVGRFGPDDVRVVNGEGGIDASEELSLADVALLGDQRWPQWPLVT